MCKSGKKKKIVVYKILIIKHEFPNFPWNIVDKEKFHDIWKPTDQTTEKS